MPIYTSADILKEIYKSLGTKRPFLKRITCGSIKNFSEYILTIYPNAVPSNQRVNTMYGVPVIENKFIPEDIVVSTGYDGEVINVCRIPKCKQ